METITINAGRLRLLLAEIESVAVKLDPNCPFDCPAKSDECGWGCSYHLEAWLTEWAEAQDAARVAAEAGEVQL
jgi:hypothetical protein